MLWFEDEESIKKTAFSVDQCHNNARTIEGLLGSDWLKKQLKHSQPSRHPIARNWGQNGVGTVLDFSIFALDLKSLERCQGFEVLLNDLKNPKKYKASRHEAHVASLFKRGNVNNLTLFKNIEGKNPDVFFTAKNTDFYVECKTFNESAVHIKFRSMSESAFKEIMNKMNEDKRYCAVQVTFLKPFCNVETRNLLDITGKLLDEFKGKELIHKEETFLIRLSDTPIETRNWDFKDTFFIRVKSPIDRTENTRIRRTIADARNSLPYGEKNIICIELPHFSSNYPLEVISTVLDRDFNQEYNEKIGGLLLIQRTNVPIAGQYRHSDDIYLLRNRHAINPIPTEIIELVNPHDFINMLQLRSGVPFYELAIGGWYGKPTNPLSSSIGFRVPLS
jgi:hypothetical protein